MIHLDFLPNRIQDHPYRDSGETVAEVKKPGGGVEQLRISAVEELPRYNESEERENAHFHSQFLQAHRAGMCSKQAQDAVAVEGRERDQVEAAQQDIEGEEYAQNGSGPVGSSCLSDCADDTSG